MAVKYLDNAGTQYLVNKIKAIDGKIPTESQITTMITSALNTYKEGIVTIVESLPQTGEEGKLYLMVDPSDSDVYIIYTWEENAFKRMGSKTFTLTVDSALSSTSTNPVQNKVIKSALDGKANSSHTHGSITNDGKLATASRVVITGTDKKIGISTVTTTQLGYLSGVTSAIQTQLDGKSATGHTHTAGDVAGLATVATSGSYNDLSNKPTINDSTITIQKNGSLVGTFTVNGSAKTIDIPVPTKTSDLTNDSNFVDTSNSAVASGITATKVTDYDSHIADTDIHVTTADKTKWNNGVSQSYVLRYSSASITDNSTIAYSTLDNTDNIKSGDKVIDVNGKIFSVVSVDTANQTVTVGSALIDLALDANVVHTSGNETISGNKTFTQNISLKSLFAEYGVTGAGISVTYSDKNGLLLAQNKLGNYQSGISYNKFSIFAYDSNNQLIDRTLTYSSSSSTLATAYFRPDNDNIVSLGTTGNRWSKVYATNYYYGNDNVEFSTKFVTTDTTQTISGAKTFSDNLTIYNSDDTQTPKGLTIRNAQWGMGESGGVIASNISFVDKNSAIPASISASKGLSGQSFLRFAVRTKNSQNNTYAEEIYYDIDTSGNVEFRSWHDNIISLGTSAYKWKDVQTKLINGLTPSSLSLPSDRSARVDISGYFTNMASGDTNTYTAPSNGWIYLALNDVTAVNLASQTSGGLTNYGDYRSRSSNGAILCLFPIRSGDVFVSQWYTTTTVTVTNAYFVPCLGNI